MLAFHVGPPGRDVHGDHVVGKSGGEAELVEALKRIYYFAKRISRLVVEQPAPNPATIPSTEIAAVETKKKKKKKGKDRSSLKEAKSMESAAGSHRETAE